MGKTNLSRLLILWLLSEGPLHGYQIKRILGDQGLQYWFPIEFGSIYSVLRFLEKKGYAKQVAVEREGRRPERTRYAITPRGRKYFADLLRDAWRQPPRIAQPVDVALAALPELTEDEVGTLLSERRAALREQQRDLDRVQRSAPSAEMVARARVMIAAELRWLDELAARGSQTGSGR